MSVIRERSVVRSSVIPSAKYCWLWDFARIDHRTQHPNHIENPGDGPLIEGMVGEVAGYMLVADGAVSASDGALDVAEGGVDPLESRVQGGLATGSSDDRLVDAAGVADPSEAVQAVADNGAGGMEIAVRQGRDFGTAETLHAAQLQADWLALWCGFDRRHDRRLGRRTAAPLAAVALPAEIGVVDLDPSGQALCGVPLHH